MDIFIKIIGLLIGLGFIYLAYQFFFNGVKIIAWIQKHKYNTTSTPRHSEIVVSKLIGALLFFVGLYYSILAILSFFA